ncbi:MAG: hypothetical protein IPK62_05500 [Bacteroidetes bacterium]|nr:hypothetical protein [Bacteroidota bacterium]
MKKMIFALSCASLFSLLNFSAKADIIRKGVAQVVVINDYHIKVSCTHECETLCYTLKDNGDVVVNQSGIPTFTPDRIEEGAFDTSGCPMGTGAVITDLYWE